MLRHLLGQLGDLGLLSFMLLHEAIHLLLSLEVGLVSLCHIFFGLVKLSPGCLEIPLRLGHADLGRLEFLIVCSGLAELRFQVVLEQLVLGHEFFQSWADLQGIEALFGCLDPGKLCGEIVTDFFRSALSTVSGSVSSLAHVSILRAIHFGQLLT
jgi:hypothetical protein